jgi:hypothetical protein
VNTYTARLEQRVPYRREPAAREARVKSGGARGVRAWALMELVITFSKTLSAVSCFNVRSISYRTYNASESER